MLGRDLVMLSSSSLLAYRLRSALTILGILVGIAAVVLLTSIGEGVRVFVLDEFTQFGTNILAITPGKTETFGAPSATVNTVRPLTLDDAAALTAVEDVLAVVPVVQGNAEVEYGARARRSMIIGVGAEVPTVWGLQVRSGRFLPADDFQSARPFAVLGSKMREELFRDRNPLGQRIRIGGDRYRIIGVMEPKGQLLGFDLDDTVYVPASKAMELFDRDSVMEIDLAYAGHASVERISSAVSRLMISRHGHEDFTLTTQDQMLEILDDVLNVLTLGVAALGGISLMVGAVGILTIMTIAVAERTPEIGLLRALGATGRQVMSLFLTEAVVLGAVGGLAGIAVALSLVTVAGLFVPALPLEAAPRYLGAALLLSIMIGLLAGILPALRASAMQPLDALRTE